MPIPKLYQYQTEDVQRMHELGGTVLQASEVGTGKTVMALTFLKERPDLRPALIVCPASLKTMWKREAWNFYGMTAVVCQGTKPQVTWTQMPDLFCINYDILRKWIPFLEKLNLKFIALDEGQYIVNLRSRRTQACLSLGKKIDVRQVLSGTPIVNKHWELFPILHFLDPKRWDSPWSFGMTFCQTAETINKGNFSGSTNHKKLHSILNGVMIRRTKKEVLPFLPKLRRCVVPFDLDRRAEYDHAVRDFLAWLSTYDMAAADRAKRAARFVKMGYLKRLVADCKMQSVFEWIDSYLASSDWKLVLGAWSRKKWPHVIQRIDERYGDAAVSIHGGVKDKDACIQRFQNDPTCRIITLQLKSGGVGINLQGAKRDSALIELPWHPADIMQFFGRVNRIGQLDPVTAYFLIGADSIEERLLEIIQDKAKILDKTLDGGRGVSTLPILDELMISMQGRRKKK